MVVAGSIIRELDGVISQKKSGAAADKAFYNKLESMVKDKKFHIRSRYEDQDGNVLRAPAGESTSTYRMSTTDGRGKKSFAEGGPYGYTGGRKGNVPSALKNQTPGFFKLEHYAATVTYGAHAQRCCCL